MLYDPKVFTGIRTLEDAKRIILTPERMLSTDERWRLETPHIVDLVQHQVKLATDTIVLDYGCGIGRIADELIVRSRCRVIGADISPNMRALAASYCKSDRFMACDPEMLDLIRPNATLAVVIWVLQHVSDLHHEIGRIRRALSIHGVLFVVNERKHRFVPTTSGWVDDGVDVKAKLEAEFKVLAEGKLDPAVVGEQQSERTFWAAYVV
jgi:ubiquinone/menaquinone biosynthesis C-methylase UbiE